MEIKDGEYRFARLSDNNLSDLVLLYKSAFKSNVSADFFKNKFETTFTGITHLGFLAYANDNTPSAFYGVFPCFVELQGRKILTAQSGDTMTDPQHQGKGLFTKLARMTYELAGNNGVKFIFGFPNKNSYPGFTKKLNWTHQENIRTYIFKTNTVPLIKVAKKLQLARMYESYALAVFRKYISGSRPFENSVIDSESGGIIHDAAFFKYKTYTRNFIVELEGVRFWLKLDGKLWIGDVERTSMEKFNKALQKLLRLCFSAGCTELTWNLSPGSYWDVLLQKKYRSSDGLPIGFLDLGNETNLPKVKFTGGDFDTF